MKAPTHVPTTVLNAIVFDAAVAGSIVPLVVASVEVEVGGVEIVTVGTEESVGTRGGAVGEEPTAAEPSKARDEAPEAIVVSTAVVLSSIPAAVGIAAVGFEVICLLATRARRGWATMVGGKEGG